MLMVEIHRNKAKIVLIGAISALAGAANIVLMVLINKYIHVTRFDATSVATFGLVLLSVIGFTILSQVLLSRLGAETFMKLREGLVKGISNLSVQQVEAIGSHRLYTALTKDVPAVHELFTMLPGYVFNGTVVLACLIYLGTLSLQLFGIFLAFLLLALGVAKFVIANRAERKFVVRRKIEDDLFRCYEALIDGNKELKFNRWRGEAFLGQELREHAESYRKATVSAEALWGLSSSWASAIVFIAIGAILFLSPAVGVLDRAYVMSFIIVIFYMVGPLNILMNSFRTIYGAKIGSAKLAELQLTLPLEPAAITQHAMEPFQSLVMRDVGFTYESQDEGTEGFSIGPLNLEITRGEIVYFVGGNGSGKTTAAKLLTGLYAVEGGDILVNGQEAASQSQHFQWFSAVFQDYYLFETLVPKDDAPLHLHEASALVKRLGLSAKVSIENGRISTTRLSYGQRKRLALLVAYFDNSDIYVFDEWAADQDPEFREFFYKELLFDLKRLGKTIVVVSHDERYFHLADKVVKFAGGSIVSVTERSEQVARTPQASLSV
ncbi:cyclic peptide export ABC transporter [Stenotrophomonas maltophilia]|uniref:Cyclic peptide export ABC transporter n=2 Tax=Gammaproteobacteria TaxID=1236 RepID=A0A6B8J6T7_STEMA|nr:cyclic peptide export ABC transporter [Stenotrophomonas maltophilia]MBH1652548.1 cyclic peptide export ABC transporter [Stenotrophomonas maltophilia]QGM02111.1 cyclic peptide export ABC transporter [Stenotrophomonas maltophilia]HDS1512137.1 cyclic peptide export ABC transporter [Stenotrophomonas maltophilia]